MTTSAWNEVSETSLVSSAMEGDEERKNSGQGEMEDPQTVGDTES